MKSDDMRHELLDICGGAHVLATQILGNADDAADALRGIVGGEILAVGTAVIVEDAQS